MADPLTKIVGRYFRRIFIWPFEAGFVFLLFFAARLLPVHMASIVLGWFLGVLGPLTPWHERAKRNLALALPALTAQDRTVTLKQMWRNLGRVLGEYPHIGQLAKTGRVEFVGLEHLQNLQTGGFLIGAHIGNWEVGPLAALSVGKKVAAIYRPLNNPLLAGLLERRQKHYGGDMYRKGREAALGMVAAMRKKQVMCLLVDQQLREGMAVPFFDHPAQTSISHIKIAIKKNVPIMYMRTERLHGCQFRVTISAPINLPADSSDDAVLTVATAINRELASWIAAQPDQWFWPHRRWGKDI
jgi:KDO2-lipid IV(A) lauroyltransferase